MTSETRNRVLDGFARRLVSAMREFCNPGFVLCAMLLLGLSVGFQDWAKRNKISLRAKLPIEMKQSLDRIDKRRLAPYEFVRHFTIESAMLGALGTDQYIHWMLEDTSVQDLAAPERYVTLFITYYTGQPDPVPHVPETCYVGSGYQPEREQTKEFPVTLNGEERTVPVKVLRFRKSGYSETQNLVVLYTFNANGQFRASRNGVRMVVGDTRAQYAYYSKVEVNFGTKGNRPTEEVAIKAGQKVFKKIIPILVENCWPDWDHESNAPAMAAREEEDEKLQE
jgi:hypothetical protein